MLFDAILHRDPDAARAVLMANPALAHARDERGMPAIVVARYRYELDIFDQLLRAAGPLDIVEATVAGDAPRVRELLQAEAALRETRTPDGFTLLHLAAYFQQEGVVRVLTALGADVHAWTEAEAALQPLHLAAGRPHNGAICAALIEAGANPDAQDEHGETPLHRAAQAGDEQTVRALLTAGANPAIETDHGMTPWEIAYALDRDALAEVLRGNWPIDRIGHAGG